MIETTVDQNSALAALFVNAPCIRIDHLYECMCAYHTCRIEVLLYEG